MAFEGHQRVGADAVAAQQVEAAEVRQVDEERRAGNEAAGAADELGRRLGRAAGGDQVIDDEDALARFDWRPRAFR